MEHFIKNTHNNKCFQHVFIDMYKKADYLKKRGHVRFTSSKKVNKKVDLILRIRGR